MKSHAWLTIVVQWELIDKATLRRYLIIGILAYLVEMASLFLLHKGAGLSPVSAVAISFWIGFVVAFIQQKLITFRNYDRRAHMLAKQLAGYSLLVAWNYGFTLLMVKFLSPRLSVFVIRTGVILVVTFWNFLTYQILFKQAETDSGK